MSKQVKIAIIVANLGTPDAPTPTAVRRFLRQFLSDQRVIELPKIWWQIILNCFILPFRPKRVAHAYATIWQQDSPMRMISYQQVERLQYWLDHTFIPQIYTHQSHQKDEHNQNIDSKQMTIDAFTAMSYGHPSIHSVLAQIAQQGYDHLLVLPLFPQYSATSTAPIYDAIAQWVLQQRNLLGLSIIRDYYAHPLYIQALAQCVRDFWQKNGQAEKLLMSFHGIPQRYADHGDPYPERCRETAQRLATTLGLQEGQWAMSFQSRFGREEWVKPYTDELLIEWATQGVQSVQIMSPAFSVDCLETLEELALQNRDLFLQHGGQSYAYIPALNAESAHMEMLCDLLAPHLSAILSNLRQC